MEGTSPADSRLRISKLAEFADKHSELFFLRYELTESARFVRPLMLILALVYMLFAGQIGSCLGMQEFLGPLWSSDLLSLPLSSLSTW